MMVQTPIVVELFRLAAMEAIERRQDDQAFFYLFKLEGLLSIEQDLSIDVNSGLIRVYRKETVEAETQLTEAELYLFIAVVQSHPCVVAGYQMLALATFQGIAEAKAQAGEGLMQPVRDLLEVCNVKLKLLGLAIRAREQETEFLLEKAL